MNGILVIARLGCVAAALRPAGAGCGAADAAPQAVQFTARHNQV